MPEKATSVLKRDRMFKVVTPDAQPGSSSGFKPFVPDMGLIDPKNGGSQPRGVNGGIILEDFKVVEDKIPHSERGLTSSYTNYAKNCCK